MRLFFQRLLSLICCVCTLVGSSLVYPKPPQTDSVRFAQSLGCGWNLGNTLDAWQLPKPEDTETCWGNVKTTGELIALVKSLGFTSVRIPVTWFQHMDSDGNIEEAWMDRVAEIVDLVLRQEMYAVVNIHHDDQDWMIADDRHAADAADRLAKVWTQIAERFAAYDETLVFDVMNEPRVVGADDEWSGNAETRAVINRLNQTALAAIRNAGGCNETRYVMIAPCCAGVSKENCDALTVPDDGHVIVSLHYYFLTAHRHEYPDCENPLRLEDHRQMRQTLRRIYRTFLRKGVGVCISEFGWTDRTHLDNLEKKAALFVRALTNYGMSCMVWDNGSDFRLIDRVALAVEFSGYADAITQNGRNRTK